MKIANYYVPTSIEEGYEIFEKKKGTIIGGGAFLHLGKRNIKSAIDIRKLGLDYIKEDKDCIEIGALTTHREIEKNHSLNKYFNGILSKTVSNIMGIQIRNMATIGGSISGKYGFSDIITSLLALNTQVVFYKKGSMSLEKYISEKDIKDILTKIIIKKEDRKAMYSNIRNTATDFSILNVAVSNLNNNCRICVGARPSISSLALNAMAYINKEGIDEISAEKAGKIAADELVFGDDIRASAIYRKKVCKIMVKRALIEVGK